MSPNVKLSSILAFIMVLPSMCATALLDMGKPQAAIALLALHAALGLGLLPFIARGILRVVIYRDLRELSDFSARLRRGELPPPFSLPVEAEDEHMLLRLKRNLNWMLHLLEDREKRLLWRLEETDQMRRDLEDLSRRDPLTGLGNRRAFEEASAHARLPGGSCRKHMLLMDCDRFKRVNDTFGHQAGDEVLLTLARIVGECVRKGMDQAFRLGGDEFAVMLDCEEEQASDVAERIRERFKEANGRGCTLSMGLAPCCAAGRDAAHAWSLIMANADAAVYRAKACGGDKVCHPPL